jgi:hypothetical protein
MKDALNGEFGTGIFAKDDQIIFMWRMLNGWAFVGLNSSSKDMEETLLNLRANFASLKDYSGIISALGKAGWTSISYQVIEGSVRNPVVMATINKILGCAADRLTTLVLLPMLTDPNQIGAVKYERINPALSQQ